MAVAFVSEQDNEEEETDGDASNESGILVEDDESAVEGET